MISLRRVRSHLRRTSRGKRTRVKEHNRSSSKPRWIQGAIRKSGALRMYMRRRYGSKAFTERGTIKREYLHKVINDPRTTLRTKKRARLALTLRGF